LAAENHMKLRIGRTVIDVIQGRKVLRIAAKHSVYLEDMITHFQQYHESVVATLQDSLEMVDYSRPALQTLRATGLNFWIQAIPEEEAALQSYFRWYTPKSGDIVVDGGANCGVSTFHFSRCVGATGRVFAIEPDEENWTLLLRNIELHGLSNVVPIKKALAAQVGTRKFHQEGCLGSGFADLVSRAEGTTNTTTVETTTLAEVIREYQLPMVGLIKLDIEGGEIEVIDSSRKLLRDRAFDFVIDSNHLIDGELTYRRLEELFHDVGYEVESREDLTGFMTTWARKAGTS
jgi:FkbM family methyltransferase